MLGRWTRTKIPKFSLQCKRFVVSSFYEKGRVVKKPTLEKRNTSNKNSTENTSVHPVLEKTLGYCLSKAAMRSKAMLDEALKPYGLLTYQFAVLRVLKYSGPLSQIVICNDLSIDKASMVRFLDGLEDLHYISRTPDKEDRRIKNIEITPKGLKMYETLEKIREEVQNKFLSPLSPTERKAYAKIIPKLIR